MIADLAVPADGRILVTLSREVDEDGSDTRATYSLWDPEHGRCLRTVPAEDPWAVVLSLGGPSSVVLGRRGSAEVWDFPARVGAVRGEAEPVASGGRSVAWAADGPRPRPRQCWPRLCVLTGRVAGQPGPGRHGPAS